MQSNSKKHCILLKSVTLAGLDSVTNTAHVSIFTWLPSLNLFTIFSKDERRTHPCLTEVMLPWWPHRLDSIGLKLQEACWFAEPTWDSWQRDLAQMRVLYCVWVFSHLCEQSTWSVWLTRRWRIIQDLTLSAWRELPPGVESEDKEQNTFGEPESPERSRDQSASHLSRSSLWNGRWLIKYHDVESGSRAAFITEKGVKSVGGVWKNAHDKTTETRFQVEPCSVGCQKSNTVTSSLVQLNVTPAPTHSVCVCANRLTSDSRSDSKSLTAPST